MKGWWTGRRVFDLHWPKPLGDGNMTKIFSKISGRGPWEIPREAIRRLKRERWHQPRRATVKRRQRRLMRRGRMTPGENGWSGEAISTNHHKGSDDAHWVISAIASASSLRLNRWTKWFTYYPVVRASSLSTMETAGQNILYPSEQPDKGRGLLVYSSAEFFYLL